MSEKAEALFDAFNTVTELKSHFDVRFKELLRSRGCRQWNDGDYEIYEMYGEGDHRAIHMKTRDGDGDVDYWEFPLSDLDVDVDELNRRGRERIEKERADTLRRDIAYKAQQAYVKEQHDRREYERLRLKYDHEPSL